MPSYSTDYNVWHDVNSAIEPAWPLMRLKCPFRNYWKTDPTLPRGRLTPALQGLVGDQSTGVKSLFGKRRQKHLFWNDNTPYLLSTLCKYSNVVWRYMFSILYHLFIPRLSSKNKWLPKMHQLTFMRTDRRAVFICNMKSAVARDTKCNLL